MPLGNYAVMLTSSFFMRGHNKNDMHFGPDDLTLYHPPSAINLPLIPNHFGLWETLDR
jgi:hypothetical protein